MVPRPGKTRRGPVAGACAGSGFQGTGEAVDVSAWSSSSIGGSPGMCWPTRPPVARYKATGNSDQAAQKRPAPVGQAQLLGHAAPCLARTAIALREMVPRDRIGRIGPDVPVPPGCPAAVAACGRIAVAGSLGRFLALAGGTLLA